MRMSSTFEDSDAAIGQRIQSIRTQKGVSQADFAEALGISVRAYQNYERGDRPVSKQLLCALKAVFGVSSDYILNGGELSESVGQSSSHTSSTSKQVKVVRLAGEMADLTHFIFNELDNELMLQEQMPNEEPFWFVANVYQKVLANLPEGAPANSEEAFELARFLSKEEVTHYNRMLAIAQRNTETQATRKPKKESAAESTADRSNQTFHGSVGQVGGGDIHNYGDKDK